MIFKEAVSAYTAATKGHKAASDAKPSPSRSSQTRGIWFLRDRQVRPDRSRQQERRQVCGVEQICQAQTICRPEACPRVKH